MDNLEIPSIGELWGRGIRFTIASYQRGYRWKPQQVNQLLKDIMQAAFGPVRPYMLQPIVLRDVGNKEYELIDGQQRLTCIWILIQYLKNIGIADDQEYYTLDYTTRKKSTQYLAELAKGIVPEPDSIDEQHFRATRDCADKFFSGYDKPTKYKWLSFLKDYVHVIWYVVEDALKDRTAEDVFMSLNRGRIPLTDSELVKTLLLVRSIRKGGKSEILNPETQTEIATQWDEMEHRLADRDFWAFLSGEGPDDGKPRMDYLLSVLPPPHGMSAWPDEFDDDFKIFNRYAELVGTFVKENHVDSNGKAKYRDREEYVHEALWRRHVRANYLKLRDWADDMSLYHKIGFLIAVQTDGGAARASLLRELLALNCSKWQIEECVDRKIKNVFAGIGNLDDLQYGKSNRMLENLLLLFNVVTCMDEAKMSQSRLCERYSFARHFDADERWSLEHINPQKEMRTLTGKQRTDRKDWHRWLSEHLNYLDVAKNERSDSEFSDLKLRVKAAVDGGEEKLTEEVFKQLYVEIVNLFNAKFDESLENGLGNLALLRKDHNSSLGASAFIVKRNKITGFVSRGEFVPLCTRRVFLKYYTDDKPGTGNARKYSFAFWTKDDAISYVDEVRERLTNYLPANV